MITNVFPYLAYFALRRDMVHKQVEAHLHYSSKYSCHNSVSPSTIAIYQKENYPMSHSARWRTTHATKQGDVRSLLMSRRYTGFGPYILSFQRTVIYFCFCFILSGHSTAKTNSERKINKSEKERNKKKMQGLQGEKEEKRKRKDDQSQWETWTTRGLGTVRC